MYSTLIRHMLSETTSAPSTGVVVCLCAEWCGVCREFRAVFDAAAQAHPDFRFRWLDVEDEAELLGDLDIETFPTLVILDADALQFAGPVVPQAAHLERLLRSVTT